MVITTKPLTEAFRCEPSARRQGQDGPPTQIEEIVLTTPGAAPHFQLTLSKVDRMDHLTVRVEADGEVSSAAIVTRIEDDIGVAVAVEVLPSGRWSARPESYSGSCGCSRGLIGPVPVEFRGATRHGC